MQMKLETSQFNIQRIGSGCDAVYDLYFNERARVLKDIKMPVLGVGREICSRPLTVAELIAVETVIDALVVDDAFVDALALWRNLHRTTVRLNATHNNISTNTVVE